MLMHRHPQGRTRGFAAIRARLPHISWRATVAHHLTEDTQLMLLGRFAARLSTTARKLGAGRTWSVAWLSAVWPQTIQQT